MNQFLIRLGLLFLFLIPVPADAGESFRNILASRKQAEETNAQDLYRLKIRTMDGKTHSLNVEIAVRPEDQVRGLMYRTDLAQDSGMLFIFSESQDRYFWMKNTYIPLDLLFIRDDGTIHHIHENAVPHDLSQIPSMGPVSAVLEINGGEVARLGIKSGDRIIGSKFFTQ